MSVYYNDSDPFVCEWLGNLIAAGHLPAGEVDSRPIQEVTPDDVSGFRHCHFFAGIGGWPLALSWAGWPASKRVWTASVPCQPLSVAGSRKGASDERHLWPAFWGLVERCGAPVIFGEQVAGRLGREWLAAVRIDLGVAGYSVRGANLPAAGVGAPHLRERLYWVAHADGGGRSGSNLHVRRPRQESAASLERGCGSLADPDGVGGQQDSGGPRGDEAADGRRPACDHVASGDGKGEGPGNLAHAERPERRTESRLGGDPGRDVPLSVREEGAARAGARGPDDGGSLGDAVTGRRERREAGETRSEGSAPFSGASDRGVGDSASVGRGSAHAVDSGGGAGGSAEKRQHGPRDDFEPGSAWRDVEWVACLDGKARPIEPGLEPLVDGLPARVVYVCPGCEAEAVLDEATGDLVPREKVGLWQSAGGGGFVHHPELACYACGAMVEHLIVEEGPRSRTGQLAGFGNAIVPQVGAVFAHAVLLEGGEEPEGLR